MDYIQQFKDELIRQDKSPNTVNNYIRSIEDYASFIKGSTGEEFNPKDMIEIDIKEYKSYLLNQLKQKPTAINNKLSGLAKFADFLVAINALTSNPVKAVNRVKMQNANTSPKTLSKNELFRLKREFYKSDNKRDIAIFEILFNTGCRVSELCSIELDDIEMSERKGSLTIRAGKGEKYRTIPLNSTARKAITDYLEVRPLAVSNKLLQGQRGDMGRESIFRVIKKYADMAKVEGVSPHTLRHCFCKELLSKGVDIVTVANLAGHSNINTTAIYTQPTEEDRISALEKLV